MNKLMKKKHKAIISGFFAVGVFILAILNMYSQSQWIYDSIATLILIVILFFIADWLKIRTRIFFLLNLVLISNALGMFDFYSLTYGFIEYDMIVHFSNALIGSYLFFNFLTRKLALKRKTDMIKHAWFMIVFSISVIMLLGTVVEIIEFSGYVFLGSGDGVFFPGDEDSNKFTQTGESSIYDDTMGDFIVNFLGSVFGTALYYFLEYRKKPWLKYS